MSTSGKATPLRLSSSSLEPFSASVSTTPWWRVSGPTCASKQRWPPRFTERWANWGWRRGRSLGPCDPVRLIQLDKDRYLFLFSFSFSACDSAVELARRKLLVRSSTCYQWMSKRCACSGSVLPKNSQIWFSGLLSDNNSLKSIAPQMRTCFHIKLQISPACFPDGKVRDRRNWEKNRFWPKRDVSCLWFWHSWGCRKMSKKNASRRGAIHWSIFFVSRLEISSTCQLILCLCQWPSLFRCLLSGNTWAWLLWLQLESLSSSYQSTFSSPKSLESFRWACA